SPSPVPRRRRCRSLAPGRGRPTPSCEWRCRSRSGCCDPPSLPSGPYGVLPAVPRWAARTPIGQRGDGSRAVGVGAKRGEASIAWPAGAVTEREGPLRPRLEDIAQHVGLGRYPLQLQVTQPIGVWHHDRAELLAVLDQQFYLLAGDAVGNGVPQTVQAELLP